MYDRDGPFGVGAKMQAMNRLHYIICKYLVANVFWKHM